MMPVMHAPAPFIVGIALTQVRVSPKTIWLFVQVTDAERALGVGEATLQREEDAVVAALTQLAPSLLGQPADVHALAAFPLAGQSCAMGAAISALDHALWDLAGQRAQCSVAQLLGTPTAHIDLYANVNRGLMSREPAGFAAGAHRAVDAGFRAVKIAPFDEIDTEGHWGPVVVPTAQNLDRGLDRIAATRDAIGLDVDLMIDCHWRFDEAWAERVIDACAPLGLYWVECPIREVDSNMAAIARLRGRTNAHGMRLAGGEEGVGRDAFRPFLQAGAYDVLMPDIKCVGGFAEMRAVAALAAQHGVAIAPHNPTGPIAHAASVHVCASLAGFTRLEFQFNETPLFEALVTPSVFAPVAGRVVVPDRPGLGVALAADMVGAYTVCCHAWGNV